MVRLSCVLDSRAVPASLLAALATLATIAASVLARPIDPNNPPEGRFSDEWAEIYMAGGKVGYAHTTMAREGEVIRTNLTFHLVLGRAEQPVKIEMVQEIAETVIGVPLNFASEMDMSVVKSATRGTIKDGRVTVVTSQYGIEQKQEFGFPAGAVMSWGAFRESLLRGFRPGTGYTLNVYAPEMRLDGSVSATTKVGEWEEFTHRGKRIKGQKVTVLMESPVGSIEAESWVDGDGMTLKALLPIPGMGNMEMLTTDQATALSDFVPPEFFMTSVVKAKRPIDYKSARRIKYRITAKDAKTKLGDLPTTEMQSVQVTSDNAVVIVLTRQSHERRGPDAGSDAKEAGKGLGPAELAEYLAGNLMINTADPALIELAKRAAGGETEPFALGEKLRHFVSEYVKTKNLSIGFATASEVARTREGDCSEHGVLLAALGRLNGLPSRVVVGLAYLPAFGGQRDIFGYHLWTQFHIDGRWIDFDAALSEPVCSPIRIAFAVSSLKNSGLADLSLPLLSKMGAIDIDVLEIE